MNKRFISSLAALVLVTGIFSSMPVYARDGSGDSTQQSTTTTSSSSSETEKSTGIENHAKDLTEQFKSQARTELEGKKTEVHNKTEEQRQKSCEARKTSITNKQTKAVTQAEKHMAVFDKIYDKVKNIKTKKNVTVPNYETLTAAVDQAQANAQANITALKNLDVSVDCSSTTVAQTLASFQAAVKSTRDSLKAYRESINKLLVAINKSLPEGDKTGNSQTETKQ